MNLVAIINPISGASRQHGRLRDLFGRLQAAGILDESNLEVAERAQRALLCLDRLCDHRHFHVVAETLLQSFDALSGLSTSDPRQRH